VTLTTYCQIGRALIPDAPLLLQAIALNAFEYHKKNNA
jgi:hypothetical protein